MIKLEGICKYYDNIFPIHEFDFTFEDKKTYIISGPSGSGKTTLLRLIMGLESLDKGRIFCDKLLLSSNDYNSHPLKRPIGMVFQTPGLWNHMSVIKNIGFGLEKDNQSKIINKVSEKLYIGHLLHKYPEHLSGGEKKRVALARMLVHKWKYLILDEPLAHVEKEMKLNIIEYIKAYVRENNTTLIYVTHDSNEIDALNGKIIKVTDLGFIDNCLQGELK